MHEILIVGESSNDTPDRSERIGSNEHDFPAVQIR
jgi:hypothetical protein